MTNAPDNPPLSIPFNRASLTGNEFRYMAQALESGWIAGDGQFTKKCQALLEELLGAPKVLLTTSCTHALEMAALLLDIAPGDEVIVPSFTFVSTVNAFVLRGARPVFIDIRPDTLNLDERRLEELMTRRTRAVAAVHYAGVGCEMDEILRIAGSRGVPVVEDNAHGLFGTYRGRPLGTIGALAALSFHETKNIVCGEGGALIINDPRYAARAEIIREKGTDRGRFFRGEIDKYSWVDIGSSYLPSDINAAFLLAQLEARESILKKRKAVWERYWDGLSDWAPGRGVVLPYVPPHCGQSHHMFYLIMPTPAARRKLLGHLRRHGILGAFHYVPLHQSLMGKRLGVGPDDCPTTLYISERLVRLPFYNEITAQDQEKVMDLVRTLDFDPAGV